MGLNTANKTGIEKDFFYFFIFILFIYSFFADVDFGSGW